MPKRQEARVGRWGSIYNGWRSNLSDEAGNHLGVRWYEIAVSLRLLAMTETYGVRNLWGQVFHLASLPFLLEWVHGKTVMH